MEISISILALDNAITSLKSLESDWNSKYEKAPATVGSGDTVKELAAIGMVYESLHTHLSSLLAGTISFLENTKQSYRESDEAASAKIQGA